MAFNHAYYNYSKKALDQIDHIDEAKSKKPASADTNLHISAFNFEETSEVRISNYYYAILIAIRAHVRESLLTTSVIATRKDTVRRN